MSTRTTLKYKWDEETQSGFHLFTDYVDDCIHGGANVVYLELSGVDFQAKSGGWVEVGIPREWAEELGLLDRISKPPMRRRTYGVLGVTTAITAITGMATGSFPLTLGVAIVAASCGWAAFIMGD